MKSCNRIVIIVALSGVSSAFLQPGRAEAQEVFAVADLGKLGGRTATALDVNRRGVVAGFADVEVENREFSRHAFIWKKGQMTDLGTLGGERSEALAIDKDVRVVGWSQIDGGREHAFLWKDGVMVDLNDLIGRQRDRWELHRATDINRKGLVVGYGRFYDGERTYTRAFMLNLARPKRIVHLGPFGDRDSDSRAYGINDVGQVVGTSGSSRGVLWDDGEIIDLGFFGQGGTIPLAINHGGDVVGYSDARGRRDHAFLWTKESGMVDLGTLGGSKSRAQAILDDGTIVGWADRSDRYPRAFIWRDGNMTDLTELFPYKLRWLNWAYGINDAGQIVGRGSTAASESDTTGSDAFIASKLCVNVKDFELECSRGDALQVTIKTRLPIGSIISVEHPVEGHQLGKIDARGRATFEWLKQSNEQKICVDGCPDSCTTTECLPPPEKYLLVDLGTLPGSESIHADGINMNGQIVGNAKMPFGPYRAVLWQDDWIFDLGTLGGSDSSATDINDAGQVVGSAENVDELGHAFLWEEGHMRDLGTLGGDYSWARGINAHGHVVGGAYLNDRESHAFLWTDDEMIDLGTLGGKHSQAWDINDAQQITGISDGNGDNQRGFFWSEGGPMKDIGTLGGTEAWPLALNDHGTVVGHSRIRGNVTRHAFLWTQDNGMVDLGTLGGNNSEARDINNSDQVIGDSRNENGDSRTFLWEDGVITDLHDLVPVGCVWDHLTRANGINERGEIVGIANDGEDAFSAFLMIQAYCGDIREFKIKCDRKNRLTARLNTTYRPGTILTLSNGDGQSQCVIINAVGRGKARWRDQSGPREICIEQCRDLCESVDCP